MTSDAQRVAALVTRQTLLITRQVEEGLLAEQRVALVTGASRGIGRAIAKRLAQDGVFVGVNYRQSGAAAEQLVGEIADAGGRAFLVPGDVADATQAREVVAKAVETGGRLDILVNNAGIIRDTLLLRMSDDDWDAVLSTNLRGAYLCTQAALRTMLRQRWGRIVNVASIAGIRGNAGQANYAAAKAGLIGFTKSVAREAASRQVTVNAVAPGLIETDITASMPEKAREALTAQIPLGRMGTPEEVAEVVAFLASERAGYITGAVIQIDGGLAM